MTATLQPRPGRVAAGADAYDCFVSYAREPSEALAQALRKGLAGMAKPWYRRRALRVFLDTASLSASPGLEGSLDAALAHSRFFILLASPEAAASPWVEREVAWWREHRDPASFLIADDGAKLRWDEQLGDFAADAQVPPSLRGWFPAEPTWTDLAWVAPDTDLSLRNSKFAGHVADLAAPLREMSKDELVDEDIKQHRRSLRLAWSAAGALLLLAVAASAAAVIAVTQRHQAIVQRDRARARALAALAEASRPADPLTSLRDATQSLAIDATPEGVRALRGTLAAPLRRVFNVNEDIGGLEFSPDGRHLAQSARSGVSLRDLRTGGVAPAAARGVTFIAASNFDASGRRLAIVGQGRRDNVLQVVDVAHRSVMDTIRVGNLADGALSPDGRTVAMATQAGVLAVRDLAGGRTVVLDRHAGLSFGLQFSPDGTRLLGIGGHGLEIWSANRPGVKADLPAADLAAARATNAGTVVGVARDGTVATWAADGRPLRRARIALGPDPAVAISSDGRLVAVGSGSSVVVWDLVTGGRRVVGSHPGGGISAVAFGPGNRSLASVASGDTLIRLWDLGTAPPPPARGKDFFAALLTASAGGALVAGVEDEGSAVAVWPRDGSRRRVFGGGEEAILAAGMMPGGRQVLTVSDDGAARLVDTATGARTLVRRGVGPADVAALSPDRRRVATAVDGGPLRVWRLAGGGPVTLARRTHGIYKLSFGADGHVAAANDARRVDVWSAAGGPPVRLSAPERIDLVSFGPPGRGLAGGSGQPGGGVFLWRTTGAGARPVLLGRHRHFVTAVAFSPDGSGVASAGDTGPVYLWPVAGGPGISLAEGTSDSTDALAFDPSGAMLAMSSGTLRILDCQACGPPSRLIAEARHLESRGGVP